MKAIIHEQFGSAEVLKLADVPKPTPKANELLIQVAAAGVNRADILQRKGHYPPPEGSSAILGLEIAGDVVEIGPNVDNYKIGDRVFGLVEGGGYAEFCILNESLAMPIPNTYDYVTAAAIPETFFTANETLFELGNLKPYESVLIHAGGSGVGITAIQMAKYVNAEIYVTAGSSEKIKKCEAIGAKEGFNYKTDDYLSEILKQTNQTGVDVIEDFLGGEYFNKNLACLKSGGRLIVVAFMNGAKVEIDLSLILRKRLQIKGSVLRTRTLKDKKIIKER
ncbi:MAG: NAD(P)H-quinone oxidoreductase, partial [Gammaproteobacteria bacterium]